MADFDAILSPAIKAAALRNGSEWVLPSPQIKEAIQQASEYLIAVLGIEAFHIQENGLRVENYTGYAFDFRGDWPSYVRQNNHAALEFIEKHELGKDYGYILTTSSEGEFQHLGRRIRDSR